MKSTLKILSILITVLFFSLNTNAKNKKTKSTDLSIKAYTYYQNDSFELAIKYSTEAINSKNKSDCIGCYLTRASSNYALNNFKEAKTDFEFISRTDKKHSYLLKIAECNIRLEILDSVNFQLNTVIKKTSDPYERAISYAYLKNKDSVFSYIKMLDSISIERHKNLPLSPTKIIIRDDFSPFKKFILYNILNEKELALQNLELAFKDNYNKFRYLEICNDFSEIRKDERFNALIKKYKESQQSNKS